MLATDDEAKLLDEAGKQSGKLWKLLTTMRDLDTESGETKSDQKLKLLEDASLSDSLSAKVYKTMIATDTEIEFMKDLKIDEITCYRILSGLKTAETKSEKYKLIASEDLTESQKKEFMKLTMSNTQYERYSLANRKGISTEVWAQFTARLEAVGGTSQKDVTKALSGMKISNEQKAVLWQLQNKSWKAESNPFSKKIGQMIKNQME